MTLILLALGTSVSAQVLRVRSGEHDGYTRLVIQVPAGTDWVMTPNERGADLNIAIKGATFDTGTVFDRLTSKRLQSLTQASSGGALKMVFGCECVATAFLHQQTMVVVDISPGKFIPVAVPKIDVVTDLHPDIARQAPPPVHFPATALASPLLQMSHRNFEGELISRILQSADREVIDLTLAGVGRRQSARFGPLRTSSAQAPNLRLSSVLDDARGLENLALPDFDAKFECITDAEMDFDSWAGPEPFVVQVAQLRTGLFQEFDRLDQEKALNLAKLYTYYGFGAETLQVLDLLPGTTAEQQRISAMASTLDGLTASEPLSFAGQQSCESAAALWALLAEEKLAPEAQLNIIEQAFNRLPEHLRRQLGSTLADLLATAGWLEAARRILRSVDRVMTAETADVTLTKATIADAEGNAGTASAHLTEVLATPSASKEAPLALARLIEKKWADRGPIPPKDLDLAAGYARELRNSELGPMMARTHVLALSMSQDFDGAMHHIQIAPDDKDWRRTRDQVLQLLAERADDITFLRYIIGLKEKTRITLSVDSATSVAHRLVNLGFSSAAREWTDPSGDQDHAIERARIRARSALLSDHPRQALLELSEDPSDDARVLRAQALARVQNFYAAAELLRETGQIEAADRLSWLAGTNEIDAEDSNVFSDLNRIRISLDQPIERQSDKPLADAKTLIKESANARAQISDMLEIVQTGGLN
ncbi:hypothetical protein [Ruegeria conchae]|uniref:hypothetical protein n=1 Tax=Ruegeria conchae TaxID=981384 RepID=UPI0029C72546|nr:hypothetical protein [Ruegeria conchae]